MGMLKACAVCCMCLSLWGFVQLLIMGVMCRMESVTFIEESQPTDAKDAKDYIEKTREGYKKVSFNCCIAGTLYGVSFAVSLAVFLHIKRSAARAPDDDDAACAAGLDSHNLDRRLQQKLDGERDREKAKELARAARRRQAWDNEEKVRRQKAERLAEKMDRQQRQREMSFKGHTA